METINVRVKRAEVKTGGEKDLVILVTEFPLALPPFTDEGQTFQFEAAAGKGALYVQKHFNINPKVTKV